MTRRFIGVRWWLSVAFAVVAAAATAIVVSQFSTQSQNALRNRAEFLALASAKQSAHDLAHNIKLQRTARLQDLELHVYNAKGVRTASASPNSVAVDAQKQERDALLVALSGRQYNGSTADGRVFVVGLPLAQGALVALNPRPDVAAAIAIVGNQALRAGVIAGVAAVLVGVVLAQLIALRLRRLSAAAEAMALGDFETPLHYRFRDEFGALAQSFERMRRQLRRSFHQIEGERDRLRMLLERLHEGVVTVDADLVVQFANAEARRLVGGRLSRGEARAAPRVG